MEGYPNEQELDEDFVQDLDWPNFGRSSEEEFFPGKTAEEVKEQIVLIQKNIEQKLSVQAYKEALDELVVLEEYALFKMNITLFGRVHQLTQNIESLLEEQKKQESDLK